MPERPTTYTPKPGEPKNKHQMRVIKQTLGKKTQQRKGKKR